MKMARLRDMLAIAGLLLAAGVAVYKTSYQ